MKANKQILESKLELMKRINKLLQLMNTMQDNMKLMADRIIKLEERLGK